MGERGGKQRDRMLEDEQGELSLSSGVLQVDRHVFLCKIVLTDMFDNSKGLVRTFRFPVILLHLRGRS